MTEQRWVLDLGCGANGSARSTCGIDMDFNALKEAIKRAPGMLVCGRGEELPFRDGCFEHVLSNVALPYMHIPTALREIQRILCPGGSVWFSLHPPSMTLKELFRAIRVGNVKNTIYRLYILANGVCFHLTGRQYGFPLKRCRCESFQTETSMRKAMQANGFDEIRWGKEGRQIVVRAKKKG